MARRKTHRWGPLETAGIWRSLAHNWRAQASRSERLSHARGPQLASAARLTSQRQSCRQVAGSNPGGPICTHMVERDPHDCVSRPCQMCQKCRRMRARVRARESRPQQTSCRLAAADGGTHLCPRHSTTAAARRASSSAPSSLGCSGGRRRPEGCGRGGGKRTIESMSLLARILG